MRGALGRTGVDAKSVGGAGEGGTSRGGRTGAGQVRMAPTGNGRMWAGAGAGAEGHLEDARWEAAMKGTPPVGDGGG